ncbi:MAG: metallophosphoesterase [Chthoniobacterales bacterium]|nr:metallophosphoesterase [Chthoniobacterales bacterium]
MTADSHHNSLPPLFATLEQRLGTDMLSRRLFLQATHSAGLTHQGEGVFVIERILPIDVIVWFFLCLFGLRKAGLRGARDLRVEENQVSSERIPAALDGFRILHLSDLHLDLQTGILDVLLPTLERTPYDLAVITGDFRNKTRGEFATAIRETAILLEYLKKPVFGVLGNHDFVEMVPFLEDAGLSLLLNEASFFDYKGARVVLAGIDDPHFYRTHDLPKVAALTRELSTPQSFRVLLSHSPETWREAEGHFDLMLCGHTHGGQICLPGGIPVVRNARCPSKLLAGAWRYGNLIGYTSRGTGCCGVPARFFCPPEITVHVFKTIGGGAAG